MFKCKNRSEDASLNLTSKGIMPLALRLCDEKVDGFWLLVHESCNEIFNLVSRFILGPVSILSFRE